MERLRKSGPEKPLSVQSLRNYCSHLENDPESSADDGRMTCEASKGNLRIFTRSYWATDYFELKIHGLGHLEMMN